MQEIPLGHGGGGAAEPGGLEQAALDALRQRVEHAHRLGQARPLAAPAAAVRPVCAGELSRLYP